MIRLPPEFAVIPNEVDHLCLWHFGRVVYTFPPFNPPTVEDTLLSGRDLWKKWQRYACGVGERPQCTSFDPGGLLVNLPIWESQEWVEQIQADDFLRKVYEDDFEYMYEKYARNLLSVLLEIEELRMSAPLAFSAGRTWARSGEARGNRRARAIEGARFFLIGALLEDTND